MPRESRRKLERGGIEMTNKILPWTLGLLLVHGCSYAVREQTDQLVCDLAAQPRDVEPARPMDQTPPPMPSAKAKNNDLSESVTQASHVGPASAHENRTVKPVVFVEQDKTKPLPEQTLDIPSNLPGANAPAIDWPDTKEEKERYLKKLYPPLPDLPPDYKPAAGPDGRPLTLSDLQRLATANSFSIKQSAAAVKAAQGAAIQAGAYPNPAIGYQADTVGNAATAGFQGFFVDQIIKTGNKLKLQQAAATMDLLNAELALRRAQSDLASQVRANYFAVLVAQENMRVNKALVRFTDSIYQSQLALLAPNVGLAAPYEPMQLRPLALQARFNFLQARNQYQASWKQLAASMGLVGMPLTELAGRVDMPVPVFAYDDVLNHMLREHTDVLSADNSIQKARYNLRLSQVAVYPDVELKVTIQKDFTAPPFQVVNSVQLGGPLPIWDHNKGNIIQAEGQLISALEGPHQARTQLTINLADAFNRYDTNRRQVSFARQQIDDQVRVYRGLYDRRHKLPADVSFGDLVTAEQTLAGFISAYVTALGAQWTATVDVANLLQSDDFFQAGKKEDVSPVPDLDSLCPLPCEHPCAPVPEKKWLNGVDGEWVSPETEPKTKPPADKPQSRATLPVTDFAASLSRPAPLRQAAPAARQMVEDDPLLTPPPEVRKRADNR
jgi:cobalt-zinc-cadmium efflux system outer membrane protein